MKTGRYMIVRILLTVLLSFAMVGYLACSAVTALLSPSVCTSIIEDEGLAEKVYAALEKDFKSAYNTTAIPPETYMDAITTEWLEEEMQAHAEARFDYMNTPDKHEITYDTDFTALEESITAFFYEYAESIDYEPDDVFEEKLSETIENAKKTVLKRMDAFYLDTLYENGMLTKVQRYLPYLNGLSWGLWGLTLVLIVTLILLDRSGGWRRSYWTGCGVFCGGVLAAAVPGYILMTDRISGFAIKDPIVYAAITDLIEYFVYGLLVKAAIFAAVGLIFIAISVVFNKKPKEAEK
ncbi:MAG: hypothetical protein IJ496_10750 [Ruminococcus sp.]|nr:hypothetical protein [Ruminococcus sp.]